MCVTREHVEAGQPTFERLGRVCDRLSAAGFPDLHETVVRHMRERRGHIQRLPELFGNSTLTADRIGRHLIYLAQELERLADLVEATSDDLDLPELTASQVQLLALIAATAGTDTPRDLDSLAGALGRELYDLTTDDLPVLHDASLIVMDPLLATDALTTFRPTTRGLRVLDREREPAAIDAVQERAAQLTATSCPSSDPGWRAAFELGALHVLREQQAAGTGEPSALERAAPLLVERIRARPADEGLRVRAEQITAASCPWVHREWRQSYRLGVLHALQGQPATPPDYLQGSSRELGKRRAYFAGHAQALEELGSA